jgi:hypothetical protein
LELLGVDICLKVLMLILLENKVLKWSHNVQYLSWNQTRGADSHSAVHEIPAVLQSLKFYYCMSFWVFAGVQLKILVPWNVILQCRVNGSWHFHELYDAWRCRQYFHSICQESLVPWQHHIPGVPNPFIIMFIRTCHWYQFSGNEFSLHLTALFFQDPF